MLEFGCPFCDWDEEAESPEQASEITGDHMRWKHIGPIIPAMFRRRSPAYSC